MSNDISGFGNNYPSALVAGPNVFTLVTTKPAHLMVTWGENPKTPQGPGEGVNIAAVLSGPGGSWTGKGNQTSGSVTNDPHSGSTKAPAGTYTLTLTPTSSDDAKQGQPAPTNVTIHNGCTIPR